MIALEVKYHRKCLTNLYNRARDTDSESGNDHFHGIVFAELVAFMEEHRREECIAPIFKLTNLACMYKARLEQLGVVVEGHIHTVDVSISRSQSTFTGKRHSSNF